MSKANVGDPVTTLAVGEEDQEAPKDTITTLAIGEEDSKTGEKKPGASYASVPHDNPLGAW